MDAKDPGKPPQDSDRRIALPTLDAPQVPHRDAGVVGERLLAQAALKTQSLDVRGDDPLPVHPGRC